MKADFATGNTHVEYDPAFVSVDDISAAITEAGYVALLVA